MQYNPGDRIASTVSGFYLSQPGTVERTAYVQIDGNQKYIVSLDCGKKISISGKHLRLIENTSGSGSKEEE